MRLKRDWDSSEYVDFGTASRTFSFAGLNPILYTFQVENVHFRALELNELVVWVESNHANYTLASIVNRQLCFGSLFNLL